MRAKGFRIDETDDTVKTWTAVVEAGGSEKEVWIEFPRDCTLDFRPGDVLASWLLLPAMKSGEGVLELDMPVSTRLLEGLDFLQGVFGCWDRSATRVRVVAEAEETSSPASGGIGLFFSGGVDSLYSLLRHESEITHLVLVHGFDIDLADLAYWSQSIARLGPVASEFGKKLVPIRTNVRDLADAYSGWDMYHGGALAGVGHALGAVVDAMYIGSTHTYRDMFPWGSHPLLDRHWSSDRVSFVHDGADCTRVEKVKLLSSSEAALRHLRVCWLNTDGAYNCGVCEKCIRTMTNLTVVGAMDRYPAFGDAVLETSQISRMKLRSENDVSFARENLEFIQAHGGSPEIERSLQVAIRRFGRPTVRSIGRRLVQAMFGEAAAQRLRAAMRK